MYMHVDMCIVWILADKTYLNGNDKKQENSQSQRSLIERLNIV